MTVARSMMITIGNGETVSESIRCLDFVKNGVTLTGLVFTPKSIYLPITTGSLFSFQVSEDNATFFPLNDAGNSSIAIAKIAGTASAHPLSAQSFTGWGFIRIVSGSTEGAARNIIVNGYTV